RDFHVTGVQTCALPICFHLAQTLAILATVLALETLLLPEGGLSWPTHLLTVVVTAADTLGTAGDLYHSFDLYDKIIHFSSGATEIGRASCRERVEGKER